MFTIIKAWLGEYALVVLAAALTAMTGFAGLQTYRLANAKRLEAEANTRLATAQAVAEAQARDLSEKYRRQEMALQGRIKENEDAAQSKVTAALAAAARANTAHDSLRAYAAQLARTCRGTSGDPALTVSGTLSSPPGDLLVDMLGRVDSAAGEIAGYADKLRIAHEACIANHESLRKEYGH